MPVIVDYQSNAAPLSPAACHFTQPRQITLTIDDQLKDFLKAFSPAATLIIREPAHLVDHMHYSAAQLFDHLKRATTSA